MTTSVPGGDLVSQRIDPKFRVVYGRLWHYVTPHKLVGFIAVVAMAATAAVEGTLVYLLKPLTDQSFIPRDVAAGKWIALWFCVVLAMRGFVGFATDWALGLIGRSVISDLRRDVFRKYLTLPLQYFEKRQTGAMLSRMSFNVEMVAESVTSVVVIAVRDTLTVLTAMGLMIYLSPTLTIFITILFPFVAMIVHFLGVAFRRYSRRIQDSVGDVTQVADEVVRGNWVVKAFSGDEYERERFDEADGRNFRQNMKLISVRGLGGAITQTLFGFGIALVIYKATQLSSEDLLTTGEFFSFFSAMMLMLQPVRRITNVAATLQRGVAGADSLFEIMDADDEIDSGDINIERVAGNVRFEDVSFSYDEEDRPVLHSIDLEINSGQTLAVVGHSGSGKSTLVNLLPRFYDFDSGDIRIDDVSIRDFTLSSLRNNISLVSQDVVLFNDTIRNNLAYGQLKTHTEEELMQAAEAAHVLEFVNELPQGFNTMVGDRGVLLSGGQRQRIAIGRALLKNSPLLILDEATSSLDTQSERRIQDALNELMRDRTTLVIAHRLSTVEKADQIIVLDAGRIVEYGTHSELLALEGHYAALYRMQFSDE